MSHTFRSSSPPALHRILTGIRGHLVASDTGRRRLAEDRRRRRANDRMTMLLAGRARRPSSGHCKGLARRYTVIGPITENCSLLMRAKAKRRGDVLPVSWSETIGDIRGKDTGAGTQFRRNRAISSTLP